MDLCLLAFEIGMTGAEQDRAEADQAGGAAHQASASRTALRRPKNGPGRGDWTGQCGHWIPLYEEPAVDAAVRFATLSAHLLPLSPDRAARN
jgi:hypothetical protein